MFKATVPPMIRSSSVGAAWFSPDLAMPPRRLRRFCLGAGIINMSLNSQRSLPRWPRSRAMPARHFHRRNGFSCRLYRPFVTWKSVPGSRTDGTATDALEAIIRRLRASAGKRGPDSRNLVLV